MKAVKKDTNRVVIYTNKDNYDAAIKQGTHRPFNPATDKDLPMDGEPTDAEEPSIDQFAQAAQAALAGAEGEDGEERSGKNIGKIGMSPAALKRQREQQRQLDKKQVSETLQSTVESLQAKATQRKETADRILGELLKQVFPSGKRPRNWRNRIQAMSDAVTMLGINNTEETKRPAEWLEDFDGLGKADVGAGSDASRAGESAVVYGLQKLVEQSKDPNFNLESALNSLEQELVEITKQKGAMLKRDWVKAAMATTRSLVDRYGLENIEDVAWDTVDGNELIGSTGHGTSADMFIKLKDGKRVGVSLKKDFAVFFMNGGLQDTLNEICGELSEESTQEICGESGRLSMGAYRKARANRFRDLQQDEDFREKAIQFYEDCKKNGNCGSLKKKDIVSRLDKLKSALNNDSEKLSGDEMKILARVADNVGSHEHIKNLRNLDNDFMIEMFKVAQDNEEFRDLLKQKVVRGLHLAETLGIGLEGLDEFVTSFGGYNLGSENLADYFLITEEDKEELKQLVSGGDLDAVERFFMDRIDLSLDDAGGRPIVRFKRSSEKQEGRAQWVTLSEASARSRGLGTLPAFELGTSKELKYMITHGGDMTKWSEKVRNAFNKIRRTQESAPPELRKLIRDIVLWKLGKYGN